MQLRFHILLLFCLLARVALSQGIQDSLFHIQQVEVTADRIFKKEEAGMKETRVDSLVLLDKINLNLSDVLAENTTVYIKNYGRGALATASFRGTAPTHTQVSWNGININSPMLGMVDFSLIPVYIIDDLSLQHGAASVSHQSGGLGGHISIDNTVDWNNKFSGRYYQGIGSYSTFDEFGQINIGNRKIQSKTRFYHNYSKNNYEFINKHKLADDPEAGERYPTQENKNAGYSKYGIAQEVYYWLSPKIITSAKFWAQDAYRNIPTVMSYEGSDTVNKSNRQDDKTMKGVFTIENHGNTCQSSFRSGIDYQVLDYVMKVMVGGYEEQKPVNSGSQMVSWYNNYTLHYQYNKNISTTFGADLNHFDISTLDSANHTGYDESRNEYSLFGGAYFSMIEKINLSIEIRKDQLPNTHTPFIYTTGISYKPIKTGDLVIKAGFVRNYHNPSLDDLYWQPGGNPDLLPEEGYTLEAGLQSVFSSAISNYEAQLTAYYSEIDNWILWLPSGKGPWEALNIKRVLAYGIESNMKYNCQWRKTSLRMHANYAFTKSLNYGNPLSDSDESKGMQLPFIPVHSGNALLALANRGFYIHYQYHYYGMRNLLSSNGESLDGLVYPFYRIYPHHLNHVALGKDIHLKEVKFGAELKVQNLFDETYRNVLNRFMPGRHYLLMLKFEF